MRLLTILIIMLLGCGGAEGPQGPQGVEGPVGPQGPAGTGSGGGGGGGKITFPSTIAAAQTRFIMLGADWTFDLPEPPATATAIYVEVNGCLGSPIAPGALVRFSTVTSVAAGYKIAVEPHRLCSETTHLAGDARQAWLPSVAPHQVKADVPPEFGSVGNPTASIRVLGWYEP